MISDSTLYTLSIFLGTLAMLLIILYHYLENNATATTAPDPAETNPAADSDKSAGLQQHLQQQQQQPHGRGGSGSANMNLNMNPSTGSGKGSAKEKIAS